MGPPLPVWTVFGGVRPVYDQGLVVEAKGEPRQQGRSLRGMLVMRDKQGDIEDV